MVSALQDCKAQRKTGCTARKGKRKGRKAEREEQKGAAEIQTEAEGSRLPLSLLQHTVLGGVKNAVHILECTIPVMLVLSLKFAPYVFSIAFLIELVR